MSQAIAFLLGALALFFLTMLWTVVRERLPRMGDRCPRSLKPSACGDANYRCERHDGHLGVCVAHDNIHDVWWHKRDRT